MPPDVVVPHAMSAGPTGIFIVGRVNAGVLPGQSTAGTVFMRAYDRAGSELWTRQFGVGSQSLGDIIVASGHLYVVGTDQGNVLVQKYDLGGNEVWTRQFASSNASDAGWGVAADATGIYVVGTVRGTLPGQTSAGGFDAFIRKYDFNGTELWTRQFGSPLGDVARAVAVASGSVYVAGQAAFLGTQDAFIHKYDADGNEIWTHQVDTTFTDDALALAADASGAYVSVVSGIDKYLGKFDPNGNELWTARLTPPTFTSPRFEDVAVGPEGVYVAGTATIALPGQTLLGPGDAFVAKLESDGTEVYLLVDDRLVKVDPDGASGPPFLTTITADVVGATGFTDVMGLAFDPFSRKLFAVSRTSGDLLTIHRNTGQASAVGPIGSVAADLVDLTIGPGGTLFALAFPRAIYRIDKGTGSPTLFTDGGIGQAMFGLAWQPVLQKLVGLSTALVGPPFLLEIDLATGLTTFLVDSLGLSLPATTDFGGLTAEPGSPRLWSTVTNFQHKPNCARLTSRPEKHCWARLSAFQTPPAVVH